MMKPKKASKVKILHIKHPERSITWTWMICYSPSSIYAWFGLKKWPLSRRGNSRYRSYHLSIPFLGELSLRTQPYIERASLERGRR
jgi:hypothetical protein